MFCIHCGTELPPQAKFCPNCGAPVGRTMDPVFTNRQKVTTGIENGHEWVDLGLSVKWASCNIGARRPEDYGSLFAWAEVFPKESYGWTSYRFLTKSRNFIDPDTISPMNPRTKKFDSRRYDLIQEMESYVSTHLTKYTEEDRITHLDISDDAARVSWGGRWRIPGESEFNELRSQCMWEWTQPGGTNGYKVIGPNGNSIFLPANGRYSMPCGQFWLSDLVGNGPVEARAFEINERRFYMIEWNRNRGLAVRPVTE